jgi:hypothetical protein
MTCPCLARTQVLSGQRLIAAPGDRLPEGTVTRAGTKIVAAMPLTFSWLERAPSRVDHANHRVATVAAGDDITIFVAPIGDGQLGAPHGGGGGWHGGGHGGWHGGGRHGFRPRWGWGGWGGYGGWGWGGWPVYGYGFPVYASDTNALAPQDAVAYLIATFGAEDWFLGARAEQAPNGTTVVHAFVGSTAGALALPSRVGAYSVVVTVRRPQDRMGRGVLAGPVGTYTVKPGDRLSAIAGQLGVPHEVLLDANPTKPVQRLDTGVTVFRSLEAGETIAVLGGELVRLSEKYTQEQQDAFCKASGGVPTKRVVQEDGRLVQYDAGDGVHHVWGTAMPGDEYMVCLFPDGKSCWEEDLAEGVCLGKWGRGIDTAPTSPPAPAPPAPPTQPTSAAQDEKKRSWTPYVAGALVMGVPLAILAATLSIKPGKRA